MGPRAPIMVQWLVSFHVLAAFFALAAHGVSFAFLSKYVGLVLIVPLLHLLGVVVMAIRNSLRNGA